MEKEKEIISNISFDAAYKTRDGRKAIVVNSGIDKVVAYVQEDGMRNYGLFTYLKNGKVLNSNNNSLDIIGPWKDDVELRENDKEVSELIKNMTDNSKVSSIHKAHLKKRDVEYVRWSHHNLSEVKNFCLDRCTITFERTVIDDYWLLKVYDSLRENEVVVSIGDYIVKYDEVDFAVFSDNEFKEFFEKDE